MSHVQRTEMHEDEFNLLVNELIGGLPLTLIVNRLAFALYRVVQAGGVPAADALRAACRAKDGPIGPDDDDVGRLQGAAGEPGDGPL